jgi:hypothetical protein
VVTEITSGNIDSTRSYGVFFGVVICPSGVDQLGE